jgi:hypothetical protein
MKINIKHHTTTNISGAPGARGDPYPGQFRGPAGFPGLRGDSGQPGLAGW